VWPQQATDAQVCHPLDTMDPVNGSGRLLGRRYPRKINEYEARATLWKAGLLLNPYFVRVLFIAALYALTSNEFNFDRPFLCQDLRSQIS